LWKSIINLKNQLLEDCGGHLVVIALMWSWEQDAGCFSSNAYAFLRFKRHIVPWASVVWEL
jgi:hypothetical protein